MSSLASLRLRADLNHLIREFFRARDVLEVETPILSVAGNTDPNIESLWLDGSVKAADGRTRRWLRTSPEFAHKRLLAAGIGDCYEIARVFRRGERGRRHNPEFTLLEWYRLGFDHRRLIDEVVDLLHGAFRLVGRELRREVASYAHWFRRTTGIDPHHAGDDELRAALAGFDVRADGLGRDDWLNLILTHRVEPAMPRDTIVVLFDFPASQAALARVRPGQPPLAERFEIYVDGVELANGYHELTDAAEQRRRFESDLAIRRARGSIEPDLDEHLLAALAKGLPSCAGVALGLDRLLMAMTGAGDIAEVIAFPDGVA